MGGRSAEALLWVGRLTSGDRGAPRSIVRLSDRGDATDAGLGEQDTSMRDDELDRTLELLARTGQVAGIREPAGGCVHWRLLRLLPTGLTATGAWPPVEERHRLPTGRALWDGRDAPLLGHVAARGPFDLVACRPSGTTRGVLFGDLPLTPADGYWSLLALRDAGLVAGRDLGADGWREVRATETGLALAGLMANDSTFSQRH